MKIDIRLPSNAATGAVFQGRTARAAAREAPRPPAVQPAGPAMERTMGDALAIARMSQSVIQRAISIALRLKSIAANAIATGDVDRRALAETVSEIRSALGERGAGTPPPLPPSAPHPDNLRVPDLGKEFTILNDALSGLEKGRIPNPGKIDGALRKLDETIAIYTRREINLLEGLSDTAPASTGTSGPSAALALRASTAVRESPFAALKAQGNLTAAAVGRLTA